MRLSEEIHNFTEFLVGEQLHALNIQKRCDLDTLQDLCCLVLNRLPPRYIRHDVDVLSAISDEERVLLVEKTKVAIEEGLKFLEQDRRKGPRD
ncbi:late competence development ComFB family protein [Agarivorans sp. MS3-6]|uniref:late competence development ComFB family protein n=1 Tax=Agarivorans sp. TSD2052 TaxID=2937286 RepID=UPI00200F1424|nr:late competence development ComFB family protein [Agarivorans sp. TSD2052]UPW17650.1 late competence development ComFB family protein [Agarivorans sp. TSD2052]